MLALRQGLIRGGELGGPLEDALLELGVQPAYLPGGLIMLGAHPRLGDGSRDRPWQTGKTLLQDEINRTALYPLDSDFFAKRSGNENERDVRSLLDGDLLRSPAVDSGQAIVGENDVVMVRSQRGLEGLTGRHRGHDAGKTIVAQRRRD